MKRKIIQVGVWPGGADESSLFALCNDGTVWIIDRDGGWNRLSPVPEAEAVSDISLQEWVKDAVGHMSTRTLNVLSLYAFNDGHWGLGHNENKYFHGPSSKDMDDLIAETKTGRLKGVRGCGRETIREIRAELRRTGYII